MKRYTCNGFKSVLAESAQDAAWQFAFKKSDRDRGGAAASRPVMDDRGLWMSIVKMKEGNLVVWLEVKEQFPERKKPQPLRGFCKPV